MGKWCEVKCDCPDEGPVAPGSRRLLYSCAHKGVYLEFWPGDLVYIGYVIREVFGAQSHFEIFTKVGDWRQYEDEYLSLSLSEVDLWEMEIEQLKRYLVVPEKVAPQPAAKRTLKGCKPVRSLNTSPESQFFKAQEKALKSFLRLNPHPDNSALIRSPSLPLR